MTSHALIERLQRGLWMALSQCRFEAAASTARDLLAIDPDNAGANRTLGAINAASYESSFGKASAAQSATYLRDAIMYLERAAAQSNVTADARLFDTLGRLYLQNGDTRKAIDAFTKVVSQNPDSAEGRLWLAQSYAANKDLKSAIETLDELGRPTP